MVADLEKHHEERYLKLPANINKGNVFSRDGAMTRPSADRVHLVIGKSAPEVCPVCDHPKAYFRIEARNY